MFREAISGRFNENVGVSAKCKANVERELLLLLIVIPVESTGSIFYILYCSRVQLRCRYSYSWQALKQK